MLKRLAKKIKEFKSEATQDVMQERLRITSIFAVLSSFCFYAYEYILRIVPSVMAPQFTSGMHLSASVFGALSAYYYLAYSPLQLAIGIILDKYDIKRTLTIASLLCATGTFIMLATSSPPLYAMSRFIQGTGSAFAWVGILKLAAVFLPKRFYGLATSFGAAFGFMGAAFGQMSIGILVHRYGGSFTLMLLTIAGFSISYLIFNEINRAQQAAERKGEFTNVYTTYKWHKMALIILRKPYIWAAGIIGVLMFTPITVFAELWGVAYLSKLYTYSYARASFIVSMVFVGFAIGSTFFGVLTIFIKDKVKIIRWSALGALITSLIILYIKLPFAIICFSCALFGVFCSAQALIFAMGRDVVSKGLAGIAGAAINFCCMGAGACFQILAGVLLDAFWQGQHDIKGLKIYPLYAYRIAVLLIPLVLLLTFLFTCLINNNTKGFHSMRTLKNNTKNLFKRLDAYKGKAIIKAWLDKLRRFYSKVINL